MNAITFSRWCGPATLASALGISRTEAAWRILKYQPEAGPSCRLSSMAKVAGRPLHRVYPDSSDTGIARVYARSGRRQGLLAHPTLAQWIREHQTGSYMVRASHHFYHIRDGKIVENNGVQKMRARVTHYVPMDKED